MTPYQSNGMRLDVSALSKDMQAKRGKLRILDNISLSILPREFVAIVGGSGAGKSTLLNALVGIRPGVGQVNLNGHDFYRDYDHFRSQLGYVPQNDILHMTLTVEKALDYAARLRLPSSITALCSDVPSNPLDPNSATKTICENYNDAARDLLINYDDDLLIKSWLVLMGMSMLFLTTTGILLARTKSD